MDLLSSPPFCNQFKHASRRRKKSGFVSGERLLRAAEKEIVGPNSKRFRRAFHYIRASKSRVHQGKGCGTAGRNMWIPGYLYRSRLIYDFRLTFQPGERRVSRKRFNTFDYRGSYTPKLSLWHSALETCTDSNNFTSSSLLYFFFFFWIDKDFDFVENARDHDFEFDVLFRGKR